MIKRKNFSKGSTLLLIIALALVLIIAFLAMKRFSRADSLSSDLAGRILLQVEDQGQAYYLNPVNLKKYYLGSPDEAWAIFREFSFSLDSEILNNYLKDGFPSEISGRIVFNAQENYEIYYINPSDLKAYSLNTPRDTFDVMSNLSIGISNDNLRTIETDNQVVGGVILNDLSGSYDNDDLNFTVTKVEPMLKFTHVLDLKAKINQADNLEILERGLVWDYVTIPDVNLEPNIKNYYRKIVAENNSDEIFVQVRDLVPGTYVFYRFYFITADNEVVYSSVHNLLGPQGKKALPLIPPPSCSSKGGSSGGFDFDAGLDKLVISKIYATGMDDFIEIYNPNTFDIDLKAKDIRIYKEINRKKPGLVMRIGNSADGNYPGGTVIQAGGRYIIARKEASNEVKDRASAIVTDKDFSLTNDNYVVYISAGSISSYNDSRIIDKVCYGDNDNCTEAFIPSIPDGQVLVRDENHNTHFEVVDLKPRLLISKIYTTGNNDYVEIYNPTNFPVDLADKLIKLYKATDNGNFYLMMDFSSEVATINPGQRYLITRDDASNVIKTQASMITDRSNFNLTGGAYTVYLSSGVVSDDNSFNIIDKVGYGGAMYYKDEAAPAIPDRHLLIRKAYASSTAESMISGSSDYLDGSSYNSNNNKEDFVLLDLRPRLLISKIYTTGNDDYVEIYNPTNFPVDLAEENVRLSRTVTSATPNFMVRIGNTSDGSYPGGTIINPQGRYLLARADASDEIKNQASAIITRSNFNLTGGAYTVYLSLDTVSSDDDVDIIDKVGYGTATYKEGEPAPAIPDNKILIRKAQSDSTSELMSIGAEHYLLGSGYDSDNNSQDFVLIDQ